MTLVVSNYLTEIFSGLLLYTWMKFERHEDDRYSYENIIIIINNSNGGGNTNNSNNVNNIGIYNTTLCK